MHSSGLSYRQRPNYYPYARERNHIVVMRYNYLEWIQCYRQQGYRILWQNETWVFKKWLMPVFCKRIIFLSGEDIDYRVPSGNGDRYIVCFLCLE